MKFRGIIFLFIFFVINTMKEKCYVTIHNMTNTFQMQLFFVYINNKSNFKSLFLPPKKTETLNWNDYKTYVGNNFYLITSAFTLAESNKITLKKGNNRFNLEYINPTTMFLQKVAEYNTGSKTDSNFLLK